ncbi:MAG: hypothetical protein ACLTLY_08655 [Agathobacter rectalis]
MLVYQLGNHPSCSRGRCIGSGKTGTIDTPLATTTIGLFNQPQKVYIDIAAWKTLPQRQMASGMAETIKHACLGSEDMFEFIEENLDDDIFTPRNLDVSISSQRNEPP